MSRKWVSFCVFFVAILHYFSGANRLLIYDFVLTCQIIYRSVSLGKKIGGTEAPATSDCERLVFLRCAATLTSTVELYRYSSVSWSPDFITAQTDEGRYRTG